MYYKWQIKRNRMNLLLFWAIFCPFTPLTTQKIKMLKKWKKNTWRYHHFTQVHHKWQSYDAWIPRHPVQQNLLSFWAFFCPFTQLTTQKIRILKNEKNNQRYHHFTQAHHKWQSYDVWFLRYKAQLTEFVLSFWAIFSPLTSLTTQKITILKKMKKKNYRYHHFTHVYQKSWSDDVWFLRYGAGKTDGQMERDGKSDV